MLTGFIHGVMNTDNTTISGETIDYGPCAFLEAYNPLQVYHQLTVRAVTLAISPHRDGIRPLVETFLNIS